MNLEPLPEDRHDEAAAFLATIFPSSADAQIPNRELRRWKYFVPHPFRAETRCYIFRDSQGIIAHGGYSPVAYVTPSGFKSSFQVIDWAGAVRCPGAGFLLFRALWNTADTYLGIGGSDDAIKVMRRIPSVRSMPPMAYFAYPLRPIGQLAASPLTWKSPGKWARAWTWRLARKRLNLSAWKAVPVDRLTESDAPLLIPAADPAYTPLRRTPELVNYWLACPAGRIRAWRLEHNSRPVGVLVLAFLKHEARIADLIVNTTSAPLSEAFSLAIDLAAVDPGACELSAANSAPPAIQAMAAAGMTRREAAEVFLGDPRKSLPENLPIEINLTIGDGFYQQGPTPYFHSF
jgi:hypothetical protein